MAVVILAILLLFAPTIGGVVATILAGGRGGYPAAALIALGIGLAAAMGTDTDAGETPAFISAPVWAGLTFIMALPAVLVAQALRGSRSAG